MVFLRSREKFLYVLIDWDAVIDLNFNSFSHIEQFHPILSRLCNLRDAIFLRVDLFPHWLFSVYVFQLSNFDYLQLGTYPNSRRTHMLFYCDVAHFYIADLDGAFVFRLLFFALFFVFSSFLGFFGFFPFPSLHFFLRLLPHKGFDDNWIFWAFLNFILFLSLAIGFFFLLCWDVFLGVFVFLLKTVAFLLSILLLTSF